MTRMIARSVGAQGEFIERGVDEMAGVDTKVVPAVVAEGQR